MIEPSKRAMTRRVLLCSAACASAAFSLRAPLLASAGPSSVQGSAKAFPLIENSIPAAILIDRNADTAIVHVADSFSSDLE
ncbi:MAG: hypothetical protein ACTHOJ_16030, partial [Sphingomonas oligoaromativorans]